MPQCVFSSQPLFIPDTLGWILRHLSLDSHLSLRLICSRLARDVCIESHLIRFRLKTIDQLDILKKSPFVGEYRMRSVKIISSSSEQDSITRALSVYVNKLNCSGCTQLTTGCLNALVNLTQLQCSFCRQLHGSCFKELSSLTALDCSYCNQKRPMVVLIH